MKLAYLLIASVMIFCLIFVMIATTEAVILYTLTNRVEDIVTASGWAAFSEIDLDTLAKRHNIADEASRDIILNKTQAESVFRDYLKDNLKLDNAYYPLATSFITLDKYPVVIDDIQIYNPNEIPATAPNGKAINNTSIYVKLQFPLEINFYGECYKKVEVVIDTKTFYSKDQTH